MSFNGWRVKHCYHKMNEVLIQATAWMDLKEFMLSKKRQNQKVTYCMPPFIEHSWNDKTIWMDGAGQNSWNDRIIQKREGWEMAVPIKSSMRDPCDRAVLFWPLWWSHESTCVIKLHRIKHTHILTSHVNWWNLNMISELY